MHYEGTLKDNYRYLTIYPDVTAMVSEYFNDIINSAAPRDGNYNMSVEIKVYIHRELSTGKFILSRDKHEDCYISGLDDWESRVFFDSLDKRTQLPASVRKRFTMYY